MIWGLADVEGAVILQGSPMLEEANLSHYPERTLVASSALLRDASGLVFITVEGRQEHQENESSHRLREIMHGRCAAACRNPRFGDMIRCEGLDANFFRPSTSLNVPLELLNTLLSYGRQARRRRNTAAEKVVSHFLPAFGQSSIIESGPRKRMQVSIYNHTVITSTIRTVSFPTHIKSSILMQTPGSKGIVLSPPPQAYLSVQ
ncbi:hypothetical protein QBC35DRAFT_13647 [Podospora australis]|uniref:Uncharacterized protein n=1 Tax=Podospora australis TaxID=1536484 RepID=A0AAN6X1Z1_9PEZI|nr:hypothetical protein QBC35DRAFT_13647 [Podospora australis]